MHPLFTPALAVLALGSFSFASLAVAQTPNPSSHPALRAEQKEEAPPKAPGRAAGTLPVHQVVLYKNGVGYFEHLGQVTGDQTVAIDFTSSQLNDVLQSLTVLDDNGGRIGGVNYNSTTPLAEQLKSLSLAMSDDPTSTELFQALRGQKVEVTGAPGGLITGHLLSIESRIPVASDADANTAKPSEPRFYLTIVATTGAVRVIELTPTLSVRPTDPALQSQLDRYLELLSSTHTSGLRHLSLGTLAGSGSNTTPRTVRVSYISEVPVWKSTYRIVFPKDGENSAILQGWAIVDNTIGSDWDNVQLSLVAGSPQSFIQPLSDPLYLRRPEIPISTEAQTTPQTHEAAEMASPKLAAEPPPPAPVASAQNFALNGRNFNQLAKIRSGTASQQVMVNSEAADVVGTGSGSGIGPGSGSGIGGGLYRTTDTNVDENISTNAFDDFFEYRLAQPVTIHKSESAMVPILQQSLPVERVTLWSASEPKPLRALWLDNTSKLTFDSGNFSVFESGAFAGEGLLDPIHPAEKRLLSYAVDQAIRVRPHPEPGKRELRRVRLNPKGTTPGTLVQQYGAESRTTYNAANSADQPRTVVLEVPRQSNRTLTPASDPAAKPAEVAANLYRFRLAVPAHALASLLIADEGLDTNSWPINHDLNQNASQFQDTANYLKALGEQAHSQSDTETLSTQLKPLIAALETISADKTQLDELTKKHEALTAEETRTRENLTALKGSDSRRFVESLNRTEDSLEQNRQQTESLQIKQNSDDDSLHQLLQTTQIDWQSPNWTAPPK